LSEMAELSPAAQRLRREIEEAEGELRRIEEQLPLAQKEYDDASDQHHALIARNPDAPSTPEEDALEQARDRAFRKCTGLMDRRSMTEAKLRRLQEPEELQRREQTSAHMREIRRRTAVAKETAKDQGVPGVYLNESGNFNIGKDARYKSDLVLSALGIVTKETPGDSLMVFEPKDAEKRLQQRDWMSFLERKREIIAEKETKAAKAQEEREVKARQRAEEKEAKAKEKAAAKAKADAEKATTPATAAAKSDGKAQSKSDQARAQREAKATAAA
jgi:hypothetical protein